MLVVGILRSPNWSGNNPAFVVTTHKKENRTPSIICCNNTVMSYLREDYIFIPLYSIDKKKIRTSSLSKKYMRFIRFMLFNDIMRMRRIKFRYALSPQTLQPVETRSRNTFESHMTDIFFFLSLVELRKTHT